MMVLSASIAGLILGFHSFPTAMGVDGHMHQPLKEAGGKPLVLLFLSHDCPVCNVYAPEIARIETRYGSRIAFDLVYCDSVLSATNARTHAKQFAINHAALLLDPKCKLAAFCKAAITPQAVIFDQQAHSVYSGRIDDRYFAIGQQRPAPTTHDLAKALDSVLAHKLPKPAAGPPVGCFIAFPNPS